MCANRNQLWNIGILFLQGIPWQMQLPNAYRKKNMIYEV